jgi:hypothetical protein
MSIDYIDFDGFGAKYVKCMCGCGTVVASRSYIEVKNREEIGKKTKVLSIKKLSNFKQTKIYLSDGSYAEPIICKQCYDNNNYNYKELDRQMKLGWEKEICWCSGDHKIKDHRKKIKDIKIMNPKIWDKIKKEAESSDKTFKEIKDSIIKTRKTKSKKLKESEDAIYLS